MNKHFKTFALATLVAIGPLSVAGTASAQAAAMAVIRGLDIGFSWKEGRRFIAPGRAARCPG